MTVFSTSSLHEAGVLHVAGTWQGFHLWPLDPSDPTIPDVVAMLLGIYQVKQKPPRASVFSRGLADRLRMAQAASRLPEGMELLENRETGSYFWQRTEGEEKSVPAFRVPGWRMKIRTRGNLTPRGMREASETVPPASIFGTPHIVVAQVLCPLAGQDLSLNASSSWVVGAAATVYATICWAPDFAYPRCEQLFERILGDVRIYGPLG